MKTIKRAISAIMLPPSIGALYATMDFLDQYTPYNPPMTVFYCATAICFCFLSIAASVILFGSTIE